MLKEQLKINEWLELIKEDKNLNGAYICISQYLYLDEKEKQELKKQLDDANEKILLLQASEPMLNYKKALEETQQKEFIEYLEDKIYSIEPKGTSINFNCEYDSEEDYLIGMQGQSRLNTLKEILQKYKEIIGDVKNENNNV